MSFSVSTAKVGGRMLRGKTSAPGLLLDGVGRSRASSSSAPQESMGRAMHLSAPYVCSMPQPSTPLHTCSRVPYSWFTCHHTPWPSGKPAGYPPSSPSSPSSSLPPPLWSNQLSGSCSSLLYLDTLSTHHPSVYVYVCSHVHMCVLLYVCICMNVYVHSCVHIRVCICISVHVRFPQWWIKVCLSPSQGVNPMVRMEEGSL